VAPPLATQARWQRLRRFFAWQLDPDHQAETVSSVDATRRFRAATLILWGRNDANFGGQVAQKLLADIPGAQRIEWMEESTHLPMLEEPEAYAASVSDFIATAPAPTSDAG
jgi:pimeloyl-ACP methyl ester carboxylesterase